ncbi:HTTM domain-containing protein [Nonlabens sp. YIK11]|uniref:HTTM domain-containing protein n=1 Tax=Nonlabens sp. YIK11 TaxID=1453349 RepID=UPI0006DCBFDB|nr:HTTM domain-containing protein [Nonlabens sp. YIK11]KQC32723.1 HTTM domain-containing protein [Nonlabens sp. YIK11]
MRATLNSWLFKQVDNSALVAFRIIFGLLLACEAFGSIATGMVRRQFIEPEFTFTFIGFEFLEPIPGNWMYVFYSVMGVAGLMVMVGYKYRIAITYYAITWTYVYLLQKSSYNNHCYLMMLLNYIMIFLPAHRSVSVDSTIDPSIKREHMSRGIYVFIIGLIWIVYAYATVAKFYPDWLDGSFPRYLMSTRGKNWDILQHEWAHEAIKYFGLTFDLLIVPFLLWKRTRWIAVAASIFFHLFNSVVFKIGIFPYMALSFLLFFFSVQKVHQWFLWKKPFYDKGEIIVPKYRNVIIAAGSIFLAVMLLLPLRHWTIKDDVFWTEEGHRLSWRMMLRSRTGRATFIIQNKDTGDRSIVNLSDYLSSKQERSVQSKPDFMWQFAQKLKQEYKAKGEDIAVYIDAQVGINGRRPSQFTDPTVDIAATEWDQFKHHEWILPSPGYDRPKPPGK